MFVRDVKECTRGKEGFFFCMLGKCIDLKGAGDKKEGSLSVPALPAPLVIIEKFTILSKSGLKRWRSNHLKEFMSKKMWMMK